MFPTLNSLTFFQTNSSQNFLYAVITGFIVYIAIQLVISQFLSRIQRRAEKTDWRFDDVFLAAISTIPGWYYILLSAYAGSFWLTLADKFTELMRTGIFVVSIIVLAQVGQKLVLFLLDRWILNRNEEEMDPEISHFLKLATRLGIWLLVALLILQNLGYQVSALLGGLGIAGIAIAFALQNVLEDIFSFFTIYFDKPFRSGEFIIVGKDLGTVKKVGIQSTRIQTLQGQELVIPNKELTKQRINNYKRMEERRIQFSFGVTYSTPTKKLKKINEMVKKIIEEQEQTEFNRIHFIEFGDSALNFEVVYHLKDSDYNLYMDTQQAINFAIKEAFEKEKIEMAFPTQTIHLEK